MIDSQYINKLNLIRLMLTGYVGESKGFLLLLIIDLFVLYSNNLFIFIYIQIICLYLYLLFYTFNIRIKKCNFTSCY